MQLRSATEHRRLRVDRREAARILQCSRDNVRRLDRTGQLKSSKQDRNGTFTYDRSEIEELARARGLGVKPTGELVARIFAMFEARKRFVEIVIETKQEPDVVQALWERFNAGYDYGKNRREENVENRREREHQAEMRAMDLELERRRRGVLFSEDAEQDATARDRRRA